MCNLYKLNKGVDEIAKLFEVEPDRGANFAAELYPGYPGLVIADGKARAMQWGFPLVLTGKQGLKLKPKPVTNARDDKLLTSFWRDSFTLRRCLIPVSQWAEPEGAAGQMTRSWYSLPDVDLITVAGLWRQTPEWGDTYAMVMTESSAQMAEVHDRMPVILRPEDWGQWTAGPLNTALALCQTWPGKLIAEPTQELWVGRPPKHSQTQLSIL